MNYRHAYHVGNFADVLKHIILLNLIQSMQRKDTGFCYLETHAGAGLYDLLSAETQKCKEFVEGAAKIFAANNPPSCIESYLTCLKKLNPQGELRHYPGSPYLAKQLLRPQDRAIVAELNEDVMQTLKKVFLHDKQVAVHHIDGYQSLKAFLPPKERRGLILIDPPYEQADELKNLPAVLAQALKRFETGVFAVWYPIKKRLHLDPFYRDLKNKIQQPMLAAELCIYADDIATQLNGCGMLIINPPWQFDDMLQNLLPWLLNQLRFEDQGQYQLLRLNGSPQ